MTERNGGMTLKRFHELLDAYGAEAGRWPEDERGAARALLGASEEARALLDEATLLDGALDALEAPAPSPALTAQIEGLVHEPRHTAPGLRAQQNPSLGQRLRAWRAAWRPAVLAASGALGLAVGIAAAQPQQTTATFDTLELSALAGGLTDLRAAELFEDQ